MMLTEFRRRAHHYLDLTPSEDAHVDWLAIMQHYGGCTRLLDFTSSFYVAAFCAMEQADVDAALWCIDVFSLEESAALKITGQPLSTLRLGRKLAAGYASSLIGEKATTNGIIPIEPERLHERLSIQQGLFLMPLDLERNFEENLRESFSGWGDEVLECRFEEITGNLFAFLQRAAVIKIVLPVSMHRTAMEDLHRMNLSAASLFPGLDGFARSQRQIMRVIRDTTEGLVDFAELTESPPIVIRKGDPK